MSESDLVGQDPAPEPPASKVEPTVEHLQELYSFVVALALARVIERMLRGDQLLWAQAGTFVAMVATLVPFYHGALRHLTREYIESPPPSRYVILGDFAFLFVEGCVMFVMAGLVVNPVRFGWALIVLLAIDVLWVALFAAIKRRGPLGRAAQAAPTHAESDADARNDETWWLIVNVVTIPVLTVLLLFGKDLSPVMLGLALAVIAVVRSGFDYYLAQELYFPDEPK